MVARVSIRSLAVLAAALVLSGVGTSRAQESQDSRVEEFRAKLRALDWVRGPRDVAVSGNSTLSLPEGYVYLDAANTTKFEELNENLSDGKEVMIAPKSLHWSAYLVFDDAGYVKDDEKIDADAILKTLKAGNEAGNEERKRRGWPELQLVGWSIPPAYNNTTKRLEWATLLRSQGGEATNFFTKILGRRGYTTVVLVSSPEGASGATAELNKLLAGYRFNPGNTYAEWRPGDKVAEYGLTGLIVGGAVAAAAKTGVLKGLFVALAAAWKLVVAGVIALFAGLKSLFRRKAT
jgi:uncharacterized membrane-anchored protein